MAQPLWGDCERLLLRRRRRRRRHIAVCARSLPFHELGGDGRSWVSEVRAVSLGARHGRFEWLQFHNMNPCYILLALEINNCSLIRLTRIGFTRDISCTYPYNRENILYIHSRKHSVWFAQGSIVRRKVPPNIFTKFFEPYLGQWNFLNMFSFLFQYNFYY